MTSQGYLHSQEVLDSYISVIKRRMPLVSRLFLKFLLNKGILLVFAANLCKTTRLKIACPVCHDPKLLVSNAFTWLETAQGNTFWYGISVEWIKLLNSKGDYYTFDT